MASTPKQRYRPTCPYFNFVCLPAGKYAIECSKPRFRRCRDYSCTATLTADPVVRTKSVPRSLPGLV